MAAQTFDEWIKENKIVRYLPYFKRCWNAAIKSAEEKFNSAAQSGPTNTAQAEIAITLLKRVSTEFHQGEECDQPSHYANIVNDIDDYISQLSAVR